MSTQSGANANFTPTRHSTSYPYISPLSLNLSGKTVLVTGAAFENGVGYATATAFARAGASAIALADSHPISDHLVERLKNAAVQARPGRPEPVVLACQVDISSLESVRELHDKVKELFTGQASQANKEGKEGENEEAERIERRGGLDVLVNNAAHMEPVTKLLDSDPDTYWRTWEVNVKGLINMARVFLPGMLERRGMGEGTNAGMGKGEGEGKGVGSGDADGDEGTKEKRGLCTMINVSSSGALSARPGGSSYRSSKLAVLRWTESLHLEYAPSRLLTYCVNPGAIRTKITEGQPEHIRNKLPDKPEIAGDTIVWLAAKRREWLGGRYVGCVWDMEELEQKREEVLNGDLLKVGWFEAGGGGVWIRGCGLKMVV
jgi:NAD(P)-dependent dehydrogenase (short-subunit alcohol dehydrogenase family)